MKVYRLITRNSYEREMFDKASLKLGLDKAVLQSMSGREGSIAGVNMREQAENGNLDLNLHANVPGLQTWVLMFLHMGFFFSHTGS